MQTICFGSIGAVIESSDIQRSAFNQAFGEFGLDWDWDLATYSTLLKRSGGRSRVALYAETKGQQVDAAAIHQRKTQIFQQALARGEGTLRRGVARVIRKAKSDGVQVALVSGTDLKTVELVRQRVNDAVSEDFDFITWDDLAGAPKPDPSLYFLALAAMGSPATATIAIEDNPAGAQAAKNAGITTVAYPGELHRSGDFPMADEVVSRDLSASEHLIKRNALQGFYSRLVGYPPLQAMGGKPSSAAQPS